MLNPTRLAPRRGILASLALFSSTARSCSLPNPPLSLDPSLRALLRDIDISLKNSKNYAKHKELEIVPKSDSGFVPHFPSKEWSPMEIGGDLDGEIEREYRKSPAALFGSHQVGSVVLPQELRSAIDKIISEGQKSLLRSDAKRLFLSSDAEDGEEAEWDAHYGKVYRSRKQTAQHAVRDGTAFVSVALPAHYSAITSVLHHAKLRLGLSWDVNRVIDWGAGTGSGLWASIYSFQRDYPESWHNEHEPYVATSRVSSYLGIDKREGLVTIGKKLVNTIPAKHLSVRWQKSFKESDKLLQEDAPKAIALSAFMLTTLPTPVAQKTLVEEMWASGAHTIVLIDHDTPEGFKAIAHAREHLLELSRLEAQDPEITSRNPPSCHVLAPCPHDQACPLLHSGGTPLICGFSQRVQRPAFVQQTKHSGVGHEDVHYSYVVIRRGPRPAPVNTSVGRIGGIGKHFLDKAKQDTSMKELEIYEGQPASATIQDQGSPTTLILKNVELTGSELQAQLRKEAYQWPRLIFPPLKKSGHIILDACTAKGKIMRLTIPKSQGKQPFYDARKSSWGDIFPHPPKNAPQERYQPKTQRKGNPASSGDDIGKRKELHTGRLKRASYDVLADHLKEKKKLSKKDYARIRNEKVWYEVSETS